MDVLEFAFGKPSKVITGSDGNIICKVWGNDDKRTRLLSMERDVVGLKDEEKE